ncbi:hypothetical protein [Agrobacterium rosae]|uniref:Uncharacterized protein n=1 Tax=Agrobacterium rosae TaxID=1972867 RepID=A0AAW9FQB0_9HYPH|nr:hypothetical protein [Agrobacterium rosae]MDX8305624.1 hypothetical protein [Agrobacterium rosae]
MGVAEGKKWPGTEAETKFAEYLVRTAGAYFVTVVRRGVGELLGVRVPEQTFVVQELMEAAMASPCVRELEWHNSDEKDNDAWACVSDFAERYSITRWWLDDRRDEVGHFEVEELGERQFGTLDEAKAAAQDDYEARIRAALSAQVQDVSCKTCDGTGKEARHQICRDCDEIALATHQIVPSEATDFMVAAAIGCDWRRGENTVRNMWRAMLAAAPAAKQEGKR